jgi:hypothetical protein
MQLFVGYVMIIVGLPLISLAESDDARITKLEDEIKKLQEVNASILKKLEESPASPVVRRRVIPMPSKTQDLVKLADPVERTAEFQGHTYKFIPIKKSWYKAKHDAEKLGGYLVCINSEKEQNFISELVTINGNVLPTWIGLTDEEAEGEWKWVDGEKVEYKNWQSNQPDNGECGGAKQNYVWLGFINSTQWDDTWEWSASFSIVEFDKPINPQSNK